MLRNFALQAATTKATRKKRKEKSCTNHFIYGSVAVFGYRFGLATFMLWLQLLLLLLLLLVAVCWQLRVQLKLVGDACLGHMCVLMPLGKSFLKAPKDDRDGKKAKLSIADRANV